MTRISFPGAPDEIPMLTLGCGKQYTRVGLPDVESYLMLDMVKYLDYDQVLLYTMTMTKY